MNSNYSNFLLKIIFLSLTLLTSIISAESLNIPARLPNAPTGSQFVDIITSMPLTERENTIYNQVAQGNIPNFMRTLCPISIKTDNHTATYYVIPDYLAIGSDDNYFLQPMSPIMAQKIADLLGCCLPTTKMVNDIWTQAAVKLDPSPIPPSPKMTTIPVFNQHNTTVWGQRSQQLAAHPLGALVSGNKKDVVITSKLASRPGKVAIYGWHHLDGKPIQPLYLGHGDKYADYSHGIRLVKNTMQVDGATTTVQAALNNPTLAPLLSSEGVISNPSYNKPAPASTP